MILSPVAESGNTRPSLVERLESQVADTEILDTVDATRRNEL